MFSFFRSFKTKKRQQRTVYLAHEGHHHHLGDIWSRVNAEYFEGKLDLKITWFRRRFRLAPRRVVLGSYHFRSKMIRINNYLDQAHIPSYFVEYIVYHEALHHVLPPQRGKRGKRAIHHAQFKAHEKKFKLYEEVRKFQKEIKRELFKISSEKTQDM
jgi:hypothetical protein